MRTGLAGSDDEPDSVLPGQRAEFPVVLVAMPFVDPYRPSIQLGLIKSVTARAGFPVRTLHAYLDFAVRIGVDDYQVLCQHRGPMTGEWLFSVAAFPETAPDRDGYFADELARGLPHLGESPEKVREKLLQIRDVDVPAYLDAMLDAFPWHEVAVAGFSSTFQQNAASFALARRLKQRHPHLVTVFGGANFDGEMGPELVRSVGCIDVAVIGEADETFPRLLGALASGTSLDTVPGLARRLASPGGPASPGPASPGSPASPGDPGSPDSPDSPDGPGSPGDLGAGQVTVTPPESPVAHLDDLPIPDYGEYFERAEDLGVLPRMGHRRVPLSIETARGCWWGAKHHCTFCGLNGTSMSFRPKSAGRVLEELAQQARRYRTFRFDAVDNIMDMAYFTGLFPALRDQQAGYELFYEVKSGLRRAQLKLMAQAGVTHIQPGIESLSTHVLHLMRKGVRAIQNVNLLRWAQYYDIRAEWNILWGFPGETEQDYAGQAAVIPHLRHLRPPAVAGRIWLERFSPLFTGHGTLPLGRRTPERSYRYVYPGDVDLDRAAYFFDYDTGAGLPDGAYADVRAAAAEWSGAWQGGPPPVLTYWAAPRYVQIYDERQPGAGGTYTFEGTLADLYLACTERPVTAAGVRGELGLQLPAEAVHEVFEEFRRRGLMFLDGELALALALPAVKGR